MRNKSLILILSIVLFTACKSSSPTSSVAQSSEAKTKEVLDHHWRTFKANDLEGTMEDYTEESILITPDKVFKGLSEIRTNFVDAFRAFPKDSTDMKLHKSVVQKDVGYIIWEANAPKFHLTYGTDTFIIRDGKILRQTYAGVAAPK